jgi:hypothetical protein
MLRKICQDYGGMLGILRRKVSEEGEASKREVPGPNFTTQGVSSRRDVDYQDFADTRNWSTVPQLWREWTVGFGNGLSMQGLKDLYGPRCSLAYSEKAMYSRRKVTIDEIRRRQAEGDQRGRGGGRDRANATARSTVPAPAASTIESAEEICLKVATLKPD